MDFLIKPCSFLMIILLTYFLKKAGLFKKEYAMIVLKILMNITIPATVVTVFGTFERNISLCTIAILGLLASAGPYFIMYFTTRKLDKRIRVYYMISSSGFNIGCYGLPIIQAFYGMTGAFICILFDIGNAIMMTSGNYAFTTVLLKTEREKDRVTPGAICKKFFSSTAVDTYLILFIACMAGLKIPNMVLDVVDPIASANAFLAMFMLGLLFEPGAKGDTWKKTLKVLTFRYAILIPLAVACFLLLPFVREVREIIVLLLLCPMGAMAPAFIEKCHGNGEMAAFTNSVSTIISLATMTILAGIFL